MRIRAQVGMVLNLDKCIGCHTCSVTCKNVWTSRDGVEYAWFNNVETKPGIGYLDRRTTSHLPLTMSVCKTRPCHRRHQRLVLSLSSLARRWIRSFGVRTGKMT